MSAPDTNIERQQKRHAPSLIGIGFAAAFGALMMIGLGFYVFGNGGEDTADAVINADQATEPSASVAVVDEVEPGTNSSD